jgi:predicted membrane protein
MKKERIFWGILFILTGIFLVVSKLGFFPDINVFSFLLTIFLAVVIVRSAISVNFAGILFPIAFLCIIYDKQLGITAITPWTVLLAALFGSIGLSIIFQKKSGWGKVRRSSRENVQYFEKIDVEDGSDVRFDTSFGASIKYINTDEFEHAEFSCSFGALKVYFDNAVMKNGSAVVRIDASFSGVELYVPKSWRVEDKTSVFLGGVSEKNRGGQVLTDTLTLVGDICFSGVEIIYV